MTDTVLKPCPFCNEARCDTATFQNHYCIQCPVCEASGPWRRQEEDAIAAWNLRAALAAPADVVVPPNLSSLLCTSCKRPYVPNKFLNTPYLSACECGNNSFEGVLGFGYASMMTQGTKPEIEGLVREIHQLVKRGEATQDHGVVGNLRCILDHLIPDPQEPETSYPAQSSVSLVIQERNTLWAALSQLVVLKDLKDECLRVRQRRPQSVTRVFPQSLLDAEAHYKQNKEAAWKAARAALGPRTRVS